MEVEMILLNLTDEILENAKEGWEVVEMEMTQGTAMEVVEEEEEEDLIQQVAMTQPILGHYWTI